MDPPVPTSPRAPRRAGPPRRRGSPRSRPSNAPRPLRWSPRAGRRGRRRPRSVSRPNSPPLIGSSSATFVPWPRTSNRRQWKPAAWRKCAIGNVRSRPDSQPWTRTTPGPGAPSRAGMNQAGRSRPSTGTTVVLERHPEVGGGRLHLMAPGIAGTRAIGEREPVRQPDLGGGDGGGDAGATNGAHTPKVTARPARLSSAPGSRTRHHALRWPCVPQRSGGRHDRVACVPMNPRSSSRVRCTASCCGRAAATYGWPTRPEAWRCGQRSCSSSPPDRSRCGPACSRSPGSRSSPGAS